jgi:hypothetical protein
MVADKLTLRHGTTPEIGFWGKVDKTLRHYYRIGLRTCRGRWWDLRNQPLARPVFVVGCSRSGTTVVYKTLSESRELGSLQRETHDFWIALHPLAEKGYTTHALTAADASARDRAIVSRYFYALTGRARVVDKNNQNGLCVPYLRALFPDAHFVYVKRSPGDNLNSLIEGWGKADEFATWSEDLPAEVAVDGGRYARWCFFLSDGWRDYLRAPIEEVCAFQYDAMNRAILDAARSIPKSQWTEIRYEDLLRDPVAAFEATFRAIDVPFTDRLRKHCETVLDRPYNAFSEVRLDKWKEERNRARIERVLARVEPVARAMGYSLP